MSDMVDKDVVRGYYDARVDGKIADFVEVNPRIEAAIETIADWAPKSPKRILEIGCGVGATSWRMASAWPDAEVLGIDISEASIAFANQCFKRPKLSYVCGMFEEDNDLGCFDLIVLMDVYEHIDPADYDSFHRSLCNALSSESRLILTVPTPELQSHLELNVEAGLQPVDEDISVSDMVDLADATETELLLARKVGIWNYGDYQHYVLGRIDSLKPVGLRLPRGFRGYRHALKSLFSRGSVGAANYLGTDFFGGKKSSTREALSVSPAKRKRLVEAVRK